jgi:hypothetical protein
VTRAVHRLESPFSLFNIKFEHVILVVSPMTGGLPNADVVHVGRLDFLVSSLAVLGTQEGLEGVENPDTVGKKEGASRRHVIEKEKFLLLSDSQVVALFSLLKKFEVLRHLFLVGERDTTNSL